MGVTPLSVEPLFRDYRFSYSKMFRCQGPYIWRGSLCRRDMVVHPLVWETVSLENVTNHRGFSEVVRFFITFNDYLVGWVYSPIRVNLIFNVSACDIELLYDGVHPSPVVFYTTLFGAFFIVDYVEYIPINVYMRIFPYVFGSSYCNTTIHAIFDYLRVTRQSVSSESDSFLPDDGSAVPPVLPLEPDHEGSEVGGYIRARSTHNVTNIFECIEPGDTYNVSIDTCVSSNDFLIFDQTRYAVTVTSDLSFSLVIRAYMSPFNFYPPTTLAQTALTTNDPLVYFSHVVGSDGMLSPIP